MGKNSYREGWQLTYSQIVVSDHSCDKFAVQNIVRCIDCPETIVGVVISIHADTERTGCPQGGRFPVVVIVSEAMYLLRKTLLFQLGLLLQFSRLLVHSFLFQLTLLFSFQVLFQGFAVTVLLWWRFGVNFSHNFRLQLQQIYVCTCT